MSEKYSPVRIHIVTVVYNRDIESIASMPEFERLKVRHPEVDLIIVDNSTDEDILEHNRGIASVKDNLRYIECGGNIGLSRAYNRALATIPPAESFWVMLADDDTHFSMEYLENGCKQIQQETKLSHKKKDSLRRNPLQMLCGVVKTDGGWISPRTEHSKEMAFSSFLIKPKPGIYQDLYPINSGLFLEGSAIQKVGGFDERLFLDQVDFLMMDRLRACGIRRIGVLPGNIHQSFSGEMKTGKKGHEEEPHSSDVRWDIFRKDFETYCELMHKPWYYRSYILVRRGIVVRIQKILGKRVGKK